MARGGGAGLSTAEAAEIERRLAAFEAAAAGIATVRLCAHARAHTRTLAHARASMLLEHTHMFDQWGGWAFDVRK